MRRGESPCGFGVKVVVLLFFYRTRVIRSKRSKLTVREIHAQASFANVTLKANKGDLAVKVYLSQQMNPGEPPCYQSTWFDWTGVL
jgi:hypothetical protein